MAEIYLTILNVHSVLKAKYLSKGDVSYCYLVLNKTLVFTGFCIQKKDWGGLRDGSRCYFSLKLLVSSVIWTTAKMCCGLTQYFKIEV